MGEVKLKLEKLKAEMEDFTAKAQRVLRDAEGGILDFGFWILNESGFLHSGIQSPCHRVGGCRTGGRRILWVLIRPIVDGLGEPPKVVESVVDDLENPLPVHLIV
jgi:hypothetical protein